MGWAGHFNGNFQFHGTIANASFVVNINYNRTYCVMNVNVCGAGNNINFRFNNLERDFGVQACAEGGFVYTPNRFHVGNNVHSYTTPVTQNSWSASYTESRMIDNTEYWNVVTIDTNVGSVSKVAAFGFQLNCIISNMNNIRRGNHTTLIWTRLN